MHRLHRQLLDAGVVGPEPLEHFHPRVRDRADISAFRCPRSGVILLSRIDHINDVFYEEGDHNDFAGLGDVRLLVADQFEDTSRRATDLRPLVTAKDWIDVGTGTGSILSALGSAAATVTAVEPQRDARQRLIGQGLQTWARIEEVPDGSADVLTEFHVFEHLPDPLGHLREARRVLRPGGRAVLEVPHARDLLLTTLDSQAFRAFTLWSEHLVLHTRDSLRQLLRLAGFTDVEVAGVQRYPLANHLHWLARCEPGGHRRWSILRDPALDAAYAARLAALDATDTLVVHATNPADVS